MTGKARRYRLGIDIGGTKINAGIIDDENRIISKSAVKIRGRSAVEVVQDAVANACGMLTSAGACYGDILACGIGIPGTVSDDGRTALKVPNLGWENEDIAGRFEAATGLPCIAVQDSKAAALGEYAAGGGRGGKVVVCVTLGTGISAGIVIDGKIYCGALGFAGECGHIPAVDGGRPCGCGKRGCVECYAAGKGLDLRAKEVFGSEYSAADVFRLAETGDEKAAGILYQAVVMLGEALVSLVNTLAPDRLLFSGGLSARTELFVRPVEEYIRSHCYSLPNRELFIGAAELGADAPMVGAAVYSCNASYRTPKISASLMCANFTDLGEALRDAESAGIDYLHFDIMDGHFVPNLMLPLDLPEKLRGHTRLPFDIHLMTERPENYIPALRLRPGDLVSVHFESTPHINRAIAMIRDAGASAALAINPGTPPECAGEVLGDIDALLVMTVNPGYAGQRAVPQCFDKIARTRKYLDRMGYRNVYIEVDGNCSYENAARMSAAGADIFVLGSSSIFAPGANICEATKRFKSIIGAHGRDTRLSTLSGGKR